MTPVAGAPTRWGSSLSGSLVHLTALTGTQPENLIVGLNPNQNMGFDNFNPYINGTGTFSFTCTGCTTASTLSDVAISFGTNGFSVPATVVGGAGAIDMGDDGPWLLRRWLHGLSPSQSD